MCFGKQVQGLHLQNLHSMKNILCNHTCVEVLLSLSSSSLSSSSLFFFLYFNKFINLYSIYWSYHPNFLLELMSTHQYTQLHQLHVFFHMFYGNKISPISATCTHMSVGFILCGTCNRPMNKTHPEIK